MKKSTKPRVYPYYRVSHGVTDSAEFKRLKLYSQVLFHALCRLRNRLAKGKDNPDHAFWRTETQLLADTGLPRTSLRRARQELIEKKYIYYDISNASFTRRFGPLYIILDDVYRKEMDEYRDVDALRHDWRDSDAF